VFTVGLRLFASKLCSPVFDAHFSEHFPVACRLPDLLSRTSGCPLI